MEEADLILRIGELLKDVFEKSVVFRAEVHEDVFEVSSLIFEFITGNQSGWWSRLLRNPLDNLILSSSTTVRLLNTIFKPKKSRETFDSKSVSELILDCGINLS